MSDSNPIMNTTTLPTVLLRPGEADRHPQAIQNKLNELINALKQP
jgi:hypothetical protein